MEELKTRFPDGVDYDIAYDTTPFIRESIDEVFKTLRDAVILVGIVVLVFLQDWRAMILPMIDVPVSLIGTFAVMAALGFSLNNLSLFGLVLAIGIVVDDAIVVLENIERMIAKGLRRPDGDDQGHGGDHRADPGHHPGAVLGVRAVLLPRRDHGPVLPPVRGDDRRLDDHLGGQRADHDAVAGRADLQDRSRGATVTSSSARRCPGGSSAMLGGLLTVWYGPDYLAGRFGLPALRRGRRGRRRRAGCPGPSPPPISPRALVAGGLIGWLIIRPVNAVLGWLFRGFNRLFDGVTDVYGWTVGKLLRISVVVLLVYGGLLVLTYWVFQHAPTGFIPQQDQGRLIVSVQLPDSASLQRTQEAMAHGRQDRPRDAGRGAHGRHLGNVVSAAGQRLELRLDVHRPRPVRQAAEPRTARRGHHGPAAARSSGKRVKDAVVTVRNSSPIPGLGVAGGFKLMVEDRGGRGLADLQQPDRRADRRR